MEQLLRATADAEARHFWFRGFRAFVKPLIQRAVGENRSARILDCGCGTGANIEMLSKFGRAVGFDLSPVGLSIGGALGRSRLVRASVAAAPFPSHAFDLVTSFDVLYALEEPDERAAITEMFRMTRPGGYVLINVAAMKVLRGAHSVLSRREVRRYGRQDLRRLVTSAGFIIERITYTNCTLFLPLLAVRMAQRWLGLASGKVELAVPNAPLNSVLTGLLLLESLWVRRFDNPFGSSLICLARKRNHARLGAAARSARSEASKNRTKTGRRGRFAPGVSGNPNGRPKGTPNKATIEVKEAARAFLADPTGQAKLLEQYRRGKLHPSVLQMFYHYAFGRPTDYVMSGAEEGRAVEVRFVWPKNLPRPGGEVSS